MKKVILVTRGRTGSSAVINELGKIPGICSTQELFLRGPYSQKHFTDYFRLIPPFDLWRQQGLWWKQYFPRWNNDANQAHKYLLCAESHAEQQKVKCLVWKLLSHHFDERPYLHGILKKHEYQVIYLKRNHLRQVLSGMVARQRGVYNSLEKIHDVRKYHIDIDEFKWLVNWERECAKNDCARLSKEDIEFVVVNYEDYCSDRNKFYTSIFEFLRLPVMLPPASDFVIMIEDPRKVIENYEELLQETKVMGEHGLD